METMASVWNYQESIDGLNDRLLYATSELESARTDSKEETRRTEENVKHLLELLKVAYQERDEARDQLQRLLNKLTSSSPTEICPVFPNLHHRNPPVNPTKGNPSTTESDSLSEIYNHRSYGSSPVDSFFDPVPVPNLSSMNIADSSNIGVLHQPFIQEYNGPAESMSIISSRTAKNDPALAVINNLVGGKVLPQKGRLLQAVMEAGPLLQTLLLSGSLPRWRNPPPMQPFQIPPISIKSYDPETIIEKLVSSQNYHLQNSLSSSSYSKISHGFPQICSTSLLNFTSGSSSCQTLNKRAVLSTGVHRDFMHDWIPTGKRQRSQ